MKIATISYDGPPIRVAVALPVSNWCPVTHEPQAGSTVTFRYTPDAQLLDILDLAWLAPDGEWPRDLEVAAVYLQTHASVALGVSVSLVARFVLASGVMVECWV